MNGFVMTAPCLLFSRFDDAMNLRAATRAKRRRLPRVLLPAPSSQHRQPDPASVGFFGLIVYPLSIDV